MIDIRNAEYEDTFKLLNSYTDSVSEYTPYNNNLLTQSEYNIIANTLAQFPYILSQWQGVVGRNGTQVIVANKDSNTNSTKVQKQRLQKSIYNFLYSALDWRKIENQCIQLIAKEGNAVIMINSAGELTVYSIFRFNIYFDSNQRTKKYAFLDKNNVEIINNLEHGKDLFHIQDPISDHLPKSPSRLDACFAFILLEQKGVKANTALFANGYLMNAFLKLNPELMPKLLDTSVDKKGKTWWENFMDNLNDRFAGFKKSGRVGFIPALDSIIEVGKNAKDAQFYDLIRELSPERVAWSYSMNLSNFGAGQNLTYNNASSFDDALYDNVGAGLENALDVCRNSILKNWFNIPISESVYVQYISPEDPKKLQQISSWREDLKNGAITVNEYRDLIGLEPIEGGDVLGAITTTDNQHTIDTPKFSFVDFEKKKTPIQKALTDKKFTDQNNGLLARFKKAFDKQLSQYAKTLENAKELPKSAKLPKFESFYSFNVLKSDLLYFAGLGLDEVKKDKRVEFKKNYFDGEYPQSILDFIDQRTEALLKGSESFDSIDVETANQIETIIQNNINLGLQKIAQLIQDKIPEISQNRAELIAHQEVSVAVEKTREIMYKNAFKGGKKSWQTVEDDLVRQSHQKNEKQGKINIDEKFKSDEQSPADAFRCRCTVLYYPPE